MPEITTRKHRKQQRRRRAKFFLGFCFLAIFAGAGVFLYFRNATKPLFLSPLPSGYKIDSVSDRDAALNNVKKQLSVKKIEYKDIKSYNNYFLVTLKEDNSQIYISVQKDIPAQIASLQLIRTRLTMEGKGIKALDLRYDKPVIQLK